MNEVFDYKWYLNFYRDLIPNGVRTREQAIRHWHQCGRSEGRRTYFFKRRVDQKVKNFGVNIIGAMGIQNGVGELSHNIARTLNITKIPYILVSNRWGFRGSNPIYDINIIISTIDGLCEPLVPLEYFEDKINILIVPWELEYFPKEWSPIIKYFHEIWTLSEFYQASIARLVPDIPVFTPKIAPPDWETPFDSTPDRMKYGIDSKTFVVLFCFDTYSYLTRKNPEAVIRAFQHAFTEQEDVLLILKAYNLSNQHLIDQTRRIKCRVITHQMNKKEVLSLINLCDVYISLHRSEGLGFTMMEAMMLGKPVIATKYSGNLDYMNSETSCLIEASLIPIHCSYYGRWPGKSHWAEPNVEQASQYLKILYQNPDLRKEYGEKARMSILEQRNHQQFGQAIGERLAVYQSISEITD